MTIGFEARTLQSLWTGLARQIEHYEWLELCQLKRWWARKNVVVAVRLVKRWLWRPGRRSGSTVVSDQLYILLYIVFIDISQKCLLPQISKPSKRGVGIMFKFRCVYFEVYTVNPLYDEPFSDSRMIVRYKYFLVSIQRIQLKKNKVRYKL